MPTDYPVKDSRGRSFVMQGDQAPTPAEVEQASQEAEAAGAFGTEPTFGSRVSEGASQFGAGVMGMISHPLKTATRLAGRDPDAIYNAYQEGRTGALAGEVLYPQAMHAKENMASAGEAVRHPLKTATRFFGGDPEAITEDYNAGRYGALAGDFVMPVATNVALPYVAGKAMQIAGPMVRSTGRGIFKQVAKIQPGVADTTNTALRGGTLSQAKNEIADTILSRGMGAPTEANQSRLIAEREAAGAAPERIIATAAAQGGVAPGRVPVSPTISKYALVNFLKDKRALAKAQLAPTAPFKKMLALVKKLPVDVPVEEAHGILSGEYGIYQRNAAKYAGTTTAIKGLMEMGLGSEIREELANAVPGLAEANARYGELKPAAEAYNQMRARHDNASHQLPNMVGLGGSIAGLVTGHPTAALAAVGGAVASHPIPQGWMAQRLYNAGGAMSGVTSADMYRAALMARLFGQNQGQ